MADTDTKTQSKLEEEINPDIREMMEAGVFSGRKKSKTHPRMKPFILNNRNGIEIINLNKTAEVLAGASEFLKDKIARGGTVLFVATQPAFSRLVVSLIEGLPVFSVTTRWLGGTLTNFKIISKRIDHFKKLKSDMQSGQFDKYTKKERLEIEREIERLTILLGGLENMARLPDVIVMVDPAVHMTAVREARLTRIPVIALTNVDFDPDMIEYPVLGNNKGRQSVMWFLDKIKEVIQEGVKMSATPATATKEGEAVGVADMAK